MKSTKIVFIVPSLADSHYKNRIMEFMDQGYEVEVLGFVRKDNKVIRALPYSYSCLGEVSDLNYSSRIPIYLKAFHNLSSKYKSEDVCFFLGGLDIAMMFLMQNRNARYIYEECDLMHTYTKFKFILEGVDKRIIKNSLITISTSEGFNQYHFGDNIPAQICLVPNKLNPDILKYAVLEKKKIDESHLNIGFVGVPRAHTDLLIETFCKSFPYHTFHLFGGPFPQNLEKLKEYENFIDHGFFKNPDDLPRIYSCLDLVLCTYDNRYINPQYAEPNKLYDSIYFETPIVVSTNTFLSEKVKSLNIGYEVDPFDEESIIEFFKSIKTNDIEEKIESCKKIDKKELINRNDHFFNRLKGLLSQ